MKHEITSKVEGQVWKDAVEKAYKEANKNFQADGFRKGHVPKEIFMKHYKEQNLWMDAAEECMQIAYEKVIEEAKDLELVAQPEVDIKDVNSEGIEFVFTLTTKPEVKLGKYNGFDIKMDEVEVTKEEVAEKLEEMRKHYAEIIIKDSEIENDDIAVIDFEGFKDGVAFEGGKGENYSLTIGSNTFIPGFEEQLLGHKKGDEVEVNVTFPEDYHSEELKGAAAVFKVTINEVKTKQIPELNEDFFEDLGMEGINSKEALEAQLEENIKARKQMDAENKYIDELLEAAANETEIDIPEVMIDEEAHRMVHQYEDTLRMQGLTLEQFFAFTNSNEEALKEQMKPEATKRVTYRLMLEEIAKVENIEISDEEANEEAENLAKRYQMEKDEFLKEFGGLEMVKYDTKVKKALEVLKK